jgi:flagellar biosynthetic protein FlhB
MASDDRTELPTGRRIDEARRRGQIARSQDLGQAAGLAAALGALTLTGGYMMASLAQGVAAGLSRLAVRPGHELSAGEVTGLAVSGAASIALLVGPIAVAAALGVVGMQVAQGGFNIASEALKIDIARLNPVTGVKKFGLKKGGVQSLKALVIVGVVVYLSHPFVNRVLEASQQLMLMSPAQSALMVWEQMHGLLWKMVLLFAVIGAADYLWQKRQWTDSLRMTKQQVKDDNRMSEGSPETKGRVRKLMFEAFKKRMMAAVPKATVVITNPTHFAVALEYQRGQMAAPMVVAKGQGHLAERIKAVAREHGVPMVENVALAQALYKTCEVGDGIPGNLFEAVAEVLAYLIRLKQLTLN